MVAKIVDGLSNTERYQARKFAQAPMVPCECGCGSEIKSVTRYGKSQRFAKGHGINFPGSKAANKFQASHRSRKSAADKKEEKSTRLKRLKIKAMKLLGNRCFHCALQYDGKNAAVFDFHHVDPSLKDGQVSAMIADKAWKVVLIELCKCELLCKNCHAVHHNGEW